MLLFIILNYNENRHFIGNFRNIIFLGLLKVLVTKLRPMLFLSGDYVCKKGDVGKEMFIVTTGQVQVVGGPDDSIVFVTLGQGIKKMILKT